MPTPIRLVFTVPALVITGYLAIRAWRSVFRVLNQANQEPAAEVELSTRADPESTEAEWEVEIPLSGGVAIYGETKVFGSNLAGLSVTLADAATARPIAVSRTFFRIVSTSFSRARLKLWHAELPAPGAYYVTVRGLRQGHDYSETRLIFTPGGSDADLAVALVPRIVLVIIAMLGFIGSLVATGMAGFGARTRPETAFVPTTASDSTLAGLLRRLGAAPVVVRARSAGGTPARFVVIDVLKGERPRAADDRAGVEVGLPNGTSPPPEGQEVLLALGLAGPAGELTALELLPVNFGAVPLGPGAVVAVEALRLLLGHRR